MSAELLFDHTLRNAMLGAAILGIVSGVIGSFALLRRQSLIGDALSHAALPGICVGFLIAGTRSLGPILAGAVVSGALAGLVILFLTRVTRLKTDAALGISLTLFFALGIVLLTYVQGQSGAAQAGLETFLFGQAAAVLVSDLILLGSLTAIVLVIVALLWKELKLTTFDPVYAQTQGLPITLLETVLTLTVAMAVVIGLQMVGVVLMAAMVIAPAAAARQWVSRLETMVLLAAFFGIIAGVTGAVISSVAPGLATGPLIVLAATAIVAFSVLLAPERGLLWQSLRRRSERRELGSFEVLQTLVDLTRDHDDPAYPVERGMLDTYHGARTAAAVGELEAKGLIASASHMPNEGEHWVVTSKGHRTAEGKPND
ncbi:metal ABC transporter permease [Rhodobacteraceae bacterium NNCM2]|nr:metal ABC transporter permease [Coraliihabitans acroporae]